VRGLRNMFCKRMKIVAPKPSWYCHGPKVNLAIEMNTESTYPAITLVFSISLMCCRRPNWTGEGWFFYFIAVYAGAPEVILPSTSSPLSSISG
jgi:hypothetical protein